MDHTVSSLCPLCEEKPTNWNLPKCYAKSIDKVFTNISDGWYVNKYNFSVKLPQKMPVCIIA